MLLLDRQAWMFSLRTFLAAIAALYIALQGDLERPYWAMATVYLVTQPWLGATRAKGFYRVGGTLAGCAVTLWMVPHLVETPLLFAAVMSLWLSACVYIALLNRGPRGYAFLLASYTSAVVCFPMIHAPEAIFATVVSRSEEILLGTVMAVLFAALFFPQPVRPMLRARIDNWMTDAAQWCALVLGGNRPHEPRNRLAADLAQFEGLIEFVRRDNPRHARSSVSMQHLHERMLMMLPVLSSIADRISALSAGGRALPPALEPLIDDIRRWLELPSSAKATDYDSLRERIVSLRPEVDGELDHLQLVTLLLRLEELVDLWHDCAVLQLAIDEGRAPGGIPRFRIRTDKRKETPIRHVDHGMALFSAASAGMALFGYCVIWILLGWEAGSSGAMMAAIVAAYFASQDDPVPSQVSFLLCLVAATVLSTIYLFGIMPAVHEFGSMVMVLAVVFVPLGLLVYRTRTSVIVWPLINTLLAQLGLHGNYSGDLEVFLNSSAAMFLGIAVAAVMTRQFRSVGAEWTARRLVRQGWETLAEAAEGHGQQDRQQFASRMLDLLGLLAPRLAATPQGSAIASVDMLTEARVGLNILQLRRARLGLPAENVEAIEAILHDIAGHYRTQIAQRRPLPAPEALRQRLDASLLRTQDVPTGKARDEALIGVLGLRSILFPDAPAQLQGRPEALTA
jgi:uncharacterized membrane protein YccC